jgi:uracil-DNA glycosylase
VSRLAAPLDASIDAVDPSWGALVDAWRCSAAGHSLVAAIDARLAAGASIYPARPLRALELTPRPSVKVVIVGQDPYHGPGQAEGLAFSVPAGVPLPPTLRNILGEQARDLGLRLPTSGSLAAWARRGVLLLNTVLTVEQGRPGSHARLGWEALTDAIIQALSQDVEPKVFMLWGAHAQSKRAPSGPTLRPHLVLRCNHPSPLSASRGTTPFIGCGHFGLANRFLAARGVEPIDWSLH